MPTTGDCEEQAAGRGYEIIDAHTHIYPDKIAAKAAESIGNFYNMTSRYSEGSIDRLLDIGRTRGVSGFLVCSVATTPQQVPSINTFIREQCDRHPEFYGFAAIHPLIENPGEEIAMARALGLLGLKLHPDFQKFNIDSKEMYEIYEAAQSVMPVLLHMGDMRYDFSHPRRLKKVLEDFPKLTVIAAHLGGWEVWDEARELLTHDNVWFDTCSALQVLTTEQAKRQILSLGMEKCFFGTDYPVWDYDKELEMFFKLGFSREDNQKILARNFKTFISAFAPPRNAGSSAGF
jgi:predicted TIM-barrel fold metal-dependent hydrolase